MNNRHLSNEEQKAIVMVENFCKKNDCEFEIIDVAMKGFLTKMKLKAKGIANFPAITFKEKVIHDAPHRENIKRTPRMTICAQ